MAERVCTKFTGKICLIPRLDEFECQRQRSGHQGQKTKNSGVTVSQLTMHSKACIIHCTLHAAADDTIASQLGAEGSTR